MQIVKPSSCFKSNQLKMFSEVNESIMKVVIGVVKQCAEMYSFNEEEAILKLGLLEGKSLSTFNYNNEKNEKKNKGRPKKANEVIEVNDETPDLFAELVMEAQKCETTKVEAPVKEKKVVNKVDKEAEKAEKEAKKLAEKAEKEAKILEEKSKKEAEKEAKKLAEKAEKEAKILEEKAKKLAEKEAKKSSEKETKKKNIKKDIDSANLIVEQKPVEPIVTEVSNEIEEGEELEVQIEVKKFNYKDGKKYLKSSEGIVYDFETQDPIGKWNEDKQEIIFDAENEEEQEEEYDD